MDLLFRAIAGGWWSGFSAGSAYTWALVAIVLGQFDHGPRGSGARRSAPITDPESTGTQAAS